MKELLKKLALVGLVAVSLTGIVACKDNSTQTPDPDPTPIPTPDPDPTPDPEPKPVTPATGAYSYVASSYEDRTEILGVLEKYAVDNQLTGITLYEDGGYVMYADNIVKGTNSYIPGYGFGVIEEGSINAPLKGETNSAYQYYYHTYEPSNPNTINYMNDKGSVVGGIIGYVSGSFWSTRMNETKDGYEWYNMLAKTKPIAVNADSNGLATTYKFALKTGKDGFKYSTLSTNSVLTKYNGMPVQAEDYLNGFKLLLTQANGVSLFEETIWENRMGHVKYLNRMGANIKAERQHAEITGPTPLHGAEITATDLRAGAALVTAGLIADGTTIINDAEHILRGYERIINKLSSVGANIKIVEV